MKLTEKNARFAVVKTAFHNGGTVSFHNSLTEAHRVERANRSATCTCGCVDIVPITEEARDEMIKVFDCWDHISLYSELPFWDAGKYTPYQLCK